MNKIEEMERKHDKQFKIVLEVKTAGSCLNNQEVSALIDGRVETKA
ncbi:hypothetical protein ACFL0H_12515 [Thermodesulfobacteriota bacterium]